MSAPIRIGVLISGSGTNLEAVLTACENGLINGRVVFAGADNEKATGLKRAQKRGIDTFVVDYKSILAGFRQNPDPARLPEDYDEAAVLEKQSFFPAGSEPERTASYFRGRAVCEAELLSHMSAQPFDLLVLAGFMRNLSPYFIDRVNTDPMRPKIMNIHPALLPAFPGTDGYGDTFRYGCKVAGCTVHFIDYGEDTGPIIGQRAFAIEENDTADSIKKKGLTHEWELYPQCIQLYAANRLIPVRMTYTAKNGSIRQRTVVRIADQDAPSEPAQPGA
ncbi:MAG: phosphoribosylglycinamide formyltransferase [Desulfosalsimonadaceae bacterium]